MMKKKIVIPTQEEVGQYADQSNASGPQGEAASNADDAKPQATQASFAKPQAAGEQAGPVTQSPPSDQARSEADEYKDKYLRSVAELSNYRKRAEKDREDSLRHANAALVRSLLNVLDNLDRVVTSAQEHPENPAAILDGAKLTADSFRKVLCEHNVTPIEAEGQPFDPVVHEALMQQPSDEYTTPTVLKVVQDGYKLYDRVIRPARVIVSASRPSGE
jgi:molecular chaperone GrpE